MFQGGVFTDRIDGGRAGAEVSLTVDSIVASTADGQAFAVPYTQCELELGGASGKMWFCRTPDRSITIFCEAAGFEAALQRAGTPALAEASRRIVEQARADSRASSLRWTGGLVAFAVFLVVAYFGLQRASRASIEMLPASVDEKIGTIAYSSMALEGDVVDDDVIEQAVAQIMDRLAPKAEDGFKFKVRVVDAPVVNAFALPGGRIVLYTGLLRAAKSPEQVAAVLAHEIAHVTRRHGMQRIAQGVGVIGGVQLLFGDVSGLAAVAVEVLQEGAINSYSREHEQEADMDGLARLRRAAIDPAAMAEMFEIFQREEGDLESAIAWLGSHPELGQRIRDARQEAKRLGAVSPKPFELSWPEVQRRSGKTLAPEAPAAAAP